MRSKTFGRALGIGVRFAGKSLLEAKPAPSSAAAEQATQAAAHQKAQAIAAAGERGRSVGNDVGKGTRNVARGTRNFGRAVWNPFALASNILWLEITGLFFALFTLFFAQHLFALRGAWRGGAEHSRFLLYAALLGVFAYFTMSSFVWARRKQKRRS